MKDLSKLSSYYFELPPELIAQTPTTPRDHSRLMIVNRTKQTLEEIVFRDLKEYLNSGDSLVFNDTKVIPARLIGKRAGGGEAEIFLVRRLTEDTWETLARPGKRLPVDAKVFFSDHFYCQMQETLPDGNKIVKFFWTGDFEQALNKYGQMPLPQYIKRDEKSPADSERYQTVYAANPGAVAAPTAGLHFTNELLQDLKAKGIDQTHITLHVGLGTFRPVKTEDIREHPMHSERFYITPEAAHKLNRRSNAHKQIIVGTTCCRTLESAVDHTGTIISGEHDTNIFIYPGYQFKYVQHLLTNFHLPGSSLLMLVCAFGGYDLMMEAYAKAMKDRFRFYSYGDAMLIL